MPTGGRQDTIPRDVRDIVGRGYAAVADVARALGATGEIIERAEQALERALQDGADARAALLEARGDRQRALELLARHEARLEAAPMPPPRPDVAPTGHHPLTLAAADALRSGQVRAAFLVLALTLFAMALAVLALSGVDPTRLLELVR